MNVSNIQDQSSLLRYKARGPGTKNHSSDQYARLLISVGQPYHEGGKLAAAIEWATNNFNHKVIFLADTLQRYNLMMSGMSTDKAMKQSRIDGDLWLIRNQSLIDGIEVFRWEEAINHPNYEIERDKMNCLYRDNEMVRQEIDRAIKEIIIRRQLKSEDISRFHELSVQYLLEEAAGKAVENEIYPGISAYPGSTPDIWSLFSKLPEFSVPKGLINDHTITLELKKA